MIPTLSITAYSFIATGLAIVALILAVIAAVSIRRDKKRAHALRLFADTNSFSFTDMVDAPLDIGLPDAIIFEQGYDQRLTNVMTGEITSARVCVLDQRYSVGSGRNTAAAQQIVVAIETNVDNLPEFVLALEDYMQNTGEAVHLDDVQTAGYLEFSERYRLYGNDKSAISGLFTPHVIESCVENQIYCIESCQGWLIVIEEDLRPTGDELQKRIESAFQYLSELCDG